ncbi:MAG: BT4734/BF3469 family protein [Bacteroidota bacterium]
MKLPLINSAYRFSYYNNLYSVESPDGEMDSNDIIEIVKYGYLKEEIEQLRKLEGVKYDNEKKKLPAITLSGLFSKRKAEKIVAHSGLIQVDIDNIENYVEAFIDICNDKYTYVCFKSPGGKGIKVIVKIIASVDSHEAQFNALERYYKNEFNITIDKNCSNLSRCLLLSHDPNLYCNPFASQFEDKYTPPKVHHSLAEEGKATYQTNITKQHQTIKELLEVIEKNNFDITQTYSDWVKIGFALCTTFEEDGRNYFHRISKYYPKYTVEETEKTYTSLLKRNNGSTKFGTLVYIARSYGVVKK